MKKNNWVQQYVCYEILMPIILILFVVSFIVSVYDLPKIAKRMPLLVGFVTLFFLVIETLHAIGRIRKTSEKTEKTPNTFSFAGQKALLFVCIMILYGLGIYCVGYLIPTCLMLVITMRLLGEKSVFKILIVSGGFLAVFYLTFKGIFGLYMPKGIFF